VFNSYAFLDGRKLCSSPTYVNSDNFDEFIDFLKHPNRKHSAVVFSLPNENGVWGETAFDIDRFMRKTVGYVHHFVVSSDVSALMSEHFGREFSVFNQAVRTYRPSFDPDIDSPFDHPVATYQKIQTWDQDIGESFSDFLVGKVLHPRRPYNDLEKEVPSFQTVKMMCIAEKTRRMRSEQNFNANDVFKMADEAVKTALTERDDWESLAKSYEDDVRQKESQIGRLKAHLTTLQDQISKLRSQDKGGISSHIIPDTFEGFEDWIKEELSGSVVVHSHAIKSLQESNFVNMKFIYEILLMMRDYYVPMRREGGLDKQGAFRQKCVELGVEDSKCFGDDDKAKKFDGDYYRYFEGEKKLMNRHLKGNSSRDPRYGFRLYYLWDEESGQVFVGHFPTHLQNDNT